MKKNQKRISEFQVPEEIIQHIQSFMDEREAARTTILSKSWYGAWSTRPKLNFDQHHFRKNEFSEFTKKTMQRYEDRNIKIHTLILGIKRCTDYSLAATLILKAIKLGATHLDIQITTSSRNPFVLPDEVFQSETLTTLSLNGCTLDLQRRRNKGVTTCSNLKSLNLTRVFVHGDIIRDLIFRCPLIEELTVGKLRTLLPFDVCTLIKLHKLKYLRLEDLNVGDSLSRSDLWPKFACLKELVIWDCYCLYEHKDVRICSTSLERIRMSCRYVNAKFDVPNIKKFEFEGDDLPRLNPSSREWEANVHINCRLYSNARASWFSALNQLVKMLGRSRLSLSICLCFRSCDGDGYVGDGLDIPALENLTIIRGWDVVSPAFLEALFWSCRPNFVNIERRCVFGIRKVNVQGFPKLRSLPLLDASRGHGKFIRFQLK